MAAAKKTAKKAVEEDGQARAGQEGREAHHQEGSREEDGEASGQEGREASRQEDREEAPPRRRQRRRRRRSVRPRRRRRSPAKKAAKKTTKKAAAKKKKAAAKRPAKKAERPAKKRTTKKAAAPKRLSGSKTMEPPLGAAPSVSDGAAPAGRLPRSGVAPDGPPGVPDGAGAGRYRRHAHPRRSTPTGRLSVPTRHSSSPSTAGRMLARGARVPRRGLLERYPARTLGRFDPTRSTTTATVVPPSRSTGAASARSGGPS
jgi:hypothetical protein